MPFSFGQVDEALANRHLIVKEARSAFANRLKHLQKLGFLPEIRTGRGRAAEYRGHHAFLLDVALEFIELGLTPERAIRAVNENLDFIVIPARWAVQTLNDKPENPDLFFVRFDPSSLNSLRHPDGNADDASFTMFYAGVGTLSDFITEMGTTWERFAAVNMTSLISHVFTCFHEIDPSLGEQFEIELTEWLETQAEDGQHGDT